MDAANLRNSAHFINPGPLTDWVSIIEIFIVTVQELAGVLHHRDGPLGDVIGNVGEVGHNEHQDSVKHHFGKRGKCKLFKKSGSQG